MWRRDKGHKFTAALLSTVMLLTMLTVPTTSAREEEPSVVSNGIESSEINDTEQESVAVDTTGQETDEQKQTDAITDSNETRDEGEVTGSKKTLPSGEASSETEETLQTSDTEESVVTETPDNSEDNNSVKNDSKDTKTKGSSNMEKQDKQEKFALKGNVTLKDLTGKNLLWKDILVRLYNADTYDEKAEKHTYLAETRTKKDGSYTFEDVKPGNYRIEFINHNMQYDDITCKWKEPANGQKKIYTVEMTRQKIGLDEDNEDNKEDNEKEQEEPEEYFAYINKIALPQEDLLRTEPDDNDTYMEVNLELVEVEAEEEEQTSEPTGNETEESEHTTGTEVKTEEAEGQTGTTEDRKATTEEEEDYSGMMSIEDLKHIDGDIAGATVEKVKRSPYDIMPMLVNAAAWSFDAYYVDEADKYDVTKTDNYFKLKYQMEFHANRRLEAEAVTIRIKRTLLEYRSGTKIVPTDIAIPEGRPGNIRDNGDIPFNYYVEEVDKGDGEKEEYLVFFNYKPIESGTNIAFQVLYKNLEAMQIQDMKDWSLIPEITVKIDETTDPGQSTPLTGCVDTGVTLTSVTKTAYREGGKSYTPGLYTKDQLMRYISTPVSSEYIEHFDNYKFVVWKVEVKGTATQPWRLEIKDTTDNGGVVVGYKAVDDDWSVSGGTVPDGYTQITDYMTSSVIRGNSGQSCSFYVVTAYKNVTAGTDITNTIDVRIRPMDNVEDMVEGSNSATWSYANYAWTYPGHSFKLEKNASSAAAYGGWLELYRRVKEREDINVELPALDFEIISEYSGYDYTHYADPELGNFGELIEGSSYTVTVVDDFVYAYPNTVNSTNYAILDGKDYYYSAITISSIDKGYDVWEDEYAEPEEAGALKIYAIYADDATDLTANDWKEVATVPWDLKGELSYTFNSEQLSHKPWRIKVVHNTTNYEVDVAINVSMRLRTDSPKLAELLQNNPNLQTMEIENLAGTTVEHFENNNTTDGTGEYAKDALLGEGKYEEPELQDNTEKMYPVLLYRNPAYVELTGLEKDAGAYKSGKTTNDPNNSRTMVTYQLSAYDGYKVPSKEMADSLKSFGVESPGRNDVVFYDLLPYGMHYDPSYEVKAVRMTGAVGSDAWKDTSDSQVSVTTEVQDNYNDTGRTRLIFRIHYAGGDSSSVYIGKNDKFGRWKEHWGVSFTAYYAWKDMSVVKSSSNICAFMPDKDDNESLLGTDEQVAKDNGVVIPSDLQNDCKYLGRDIDGDGIIDGDIDGDGNTDEQTVLYATTRVFEDVAISTKSKIEKLVRADSDVYDVYRESAVVAPGKGYTYDITVSTLEESIGNIVIFDRLENTAEEEEFKDVLGTLDAAPWHGTFVSVVTGGLEALGIQPVIYYNAERNAAIPSDNEPANSILTEDKGWFKAEDWELGPEAVAAVAVDLGDYSLEGGQSVSFQIKMQAPVEEAINNSHAYNNPYYRSTTNEGVKMTGNITSVRLFGMEEVEVIKEFTGDIPEDVADTSFEFYLTQNENNASGKFSNKEYQLYKKVDDEWERQGEGRIYATDVDGRLMLRAGEKAVFQVADAERIDVNEKENPYWRVEETDEWTEPAGVFRQHTFTFTNAYRPILYVQKNLKSVPQGVDVSNDTFTFQVFADGEPLANAEFWYLDRVCLDGGIPDKVKSLGTEGIGTTDDEGKLEIKANEIIGLFPGNVETSYMVQEIVDIGEDFPTWICEDGKNIAEGSLALRGASVTISNIYAKKELRLTKKIEYQDEEECTQEFTFQVLDITGNPDGEPVRSGNRWVLLDGSTETEIEGTLNEDDGTFTYALAGKTVKICDLQADHTYLIKEIDSGEFYLPVQDAQEVTMPIYASGDNVTFTNNYQKRSLTVTKQVAYSANTDATQLAEINNRDFEMTLQIMEVKTGETHSKAKFVRTSQDGEETEGETDETGTFTIKNGESVFFKDVGVRGDKITVTETPDEDYPQLYPADGKPHAEILEDTKCQMDFVNGQQGNLVVINDVVAVDKGGQELLDAMKNTPQQYANYFYPYSMNPTDPAARNSSYPPPYFQFDFKLNAVSNGEQEISWKKSDEVKAVNQLALWWNYSYYTRYGTDTTAYLYPGDIIVVPTNTALANAVFNYAVTMDEQHQVWCWNPNYGVRRWFEFSLVEPENGGTIEGTLEKNPVATFVSEVREITFDGSKIEKRMVPGSNAVPEGAKLVWRLERYDGSKWNPAASVSYAVMDETGCPDADGIQLTGKDGRITLTKNAVTYPVVQFLEDTVYLNRYNNASVGDLRLVEIFEESDESWGRLAGYGDKTGEYSPSMSSDKAVAFVNSNRTTPMQVEKEMGTTSEESFTMYLRQVLSSSRDTITTTGDIIESVEGAGIEYILYDSRTNKETGRGITGEKGEIQVKAGEYATLYLPDKTVWTVEEDIKVNYELKDLHGTPEEEVKIFKKLDHNLMLVYLKAETTKFGMLKAKYKNANYNYAYVYRGNYGDLNMNSNYVVELYDSDGQYVKTLNAGEFLVDVKKVVSGSDFNFTGFVQIPIYGQGNDAAGLSTTVTVPVIYTTVDIRKKSDLMDFHLEIDADGNLEIPLAVKDGRDNGKYNDILVAVNRVQDLEDCQNPDLRHLVIEEGVRYVDSLACPNLESVVIPGSNQSTDSSFIGIKSSSQDTTGRYTYSSMCPNLKTVVIKDGVTSIPSNSFAGCSKLTDITIPDSVTSIGSSAFSGCSELTEIAIPERVTSIGSSAFSGCSGLTEIAIPERVTLIGDYTFLGCTDLTTITIPENVTSIYQYAFSGCTGLTTITIPERVTSIGSSAFSGCSGLTEIKMPGLTSIGANTFSDCTKLKSVDLGQVTYLEVILFSGCTSLKEITIPKTVRSVDGDRFYKDSSIETIIFEDGISLGSKTFFRNGGNLRKIVLPKSVGQVPGDLPFKDCFSLEEIHIDNTMENFTRYHTLDSLGIPSGVIIYWNDGTVTDNTGNVITP